MMNAPDLVPVLNFNPLLDNLIGDIIDKLGIGADRNCLNQLNAILVEIRRRVGDNFSELPTDQSWYKKGTENGLQKIHRKVINICATNFGVYANVHDIELFSRANTEAVNVVAVTLLSLLKYIVQNLTAEKDGVLKNVFDQEKHKKANLMIEKWLQERQPKYMWSRYDDRKNQSFSTPVLKNYEKEVKSSRKSTEKYERENETLKVSAKSSNEQMTTQIKKLEQEIQDLQSDSETWKSVEECYKTMIQDLEDENKSLKVATSSTAIKEFKKIGKECETKIEQLEEELVIERELANQKLDERQRFFDQKLMDLNLIVERKDAMIANLEKDLKSEQEFAKQNLDDILKKSSEYDEAQKNFDEKLEKRDAMILKLTEELNLKETENIERHSAWEKILITLEEYERRIHEFESKLTDFEIIQKKMVEAEEAQKIFEEMLHEKDNMILKLKEDLVLKENENAEIQNKLSELVQESQLATDDLEKMYLMVKKYKTKILQFEQDFKEIQKKIVESDEARKIAENELQAVSAAAKLFFEQLTTRIKTLEDENESLKIATNSELENLTTEIKQFEKIQKGNESKILEFEDELKTEREIATKNLDEFQKKIVESDEARKIAEDELQGLNLDVEEKEHKISELEIELKTKMDEYLQNIMGCEEELERVLARENELKKELENVKIVIGEKETKISELENGWQHDKNEAEVELKAAKEKFVEASKTWKISEERLMKSIADLITENEMVKVVDNPVIPFLELDNLDDTASEADSGFGNSARTFCQDGNENKMNPKSQEKKINYLPWICGIVFVIFGIFSALIYNGLGTGNESVNYFTELLTEYFVD